MAIGSTRFPVLLIGCLGAAGCRAARPAVAGSDATVRTAITQALPVMNGATLKAIVLEVSYPPGGSSSAHSHPCPVIVYVLEGIYRTQLKGGEPKLLGPGESFYEEPNSTHLVSANGSDEKPVRFLASFLCDRDTPLTVGVPEAGRDSAR